MELRSGVLQKIIRIRGTHPPVMVQLVGVVCGWVEDGRFDLPLVNPVPDPYLARLEAATTRQTVVRLALPVVCKQTNQRGDSQVSREFGGFSSHLRREFHPGDKGGRGSPHSRADFTRAKSHPSGVEVVNLWGAASPSGCQSVCCDAN